MPRPITHGSEAVAPLHHTPARAGRTPTRRNVEPVAPTPAGLARTNLLAGLYRIRERLVANGQWPVAPTGETRGTAARSPRRSGGSTLASPAGVTTRPSSFSLGHGRADAPARAESLEVPAC